MTAKPKPINKSAKTAPETGPSYAEPVLGNPASTLMESGVGNCFPGLEFDLRQLDVRFFPGLVFEFPGVTPAGPDGTQGARLIYSDPDGDPLLADSGIDGPQWITDLKRQYAGPEGAALDDGQWYLFWVEQDGKRIEMYDYTLYQNAAARIPYEGETCWWIIRLIEPEKPLTIALSQRDGAGAPAGEPVILTGRRRIYLDAEGMIDPVYHPGELTSSMCSPWTHDFRDCACHYWASNHPDVALGEVRDPQDRLDNETSRDDPAQALNFVDWMRRRSLPLKDVSAQTTIEKTRPERYDPYEINLKWEELDFVLEGQEATETPGLALRYASTPYKDIAEMIADLSGELAQLELSLAMVYLYAYFSLRAPDEVTPEQEAAWPGLTEDLRAARQLLLSVALSEMTHLRWVNQVLWLIYRAFPDQGTYEPVLTPGGLIAPPSKKSAKASGKKAAPVHGDKWELKRATQEALETFIAVERPDGALDTEYIKLVQYLRDSGAPFPEGLYQLAARIDSDGLQHYQKFKDIKRILEPYSQQGSLYLRDVKLAEAPFDDKVDAAMSQIQTALDALGEAYKLEAARKDLSTANDHIKTARAAMHQVNELGEELARKNVGLPFYAVDGAVH